MKTIKLIFYWLSVIRPVIDALKGAIEGMKLGHEDVKAQAIKKLEQEQQERFDKANR